tara:strand:- start:329 stop:457 length:129 start_codon:yes stop_codon:yes gene_type:complete
MASFSMLPLSREAVDTFHTAAPSEDGRDVGAPAAIHKALMMT